MKKICFLICLSINAFGQNSRLDYPIAPIDSVSDNYFGTIVRDPYRGLEYDSLTSTSEWLDKEAEVTKKYLKKATNRYYPDHQLKRNAHYSFGTLYKSGHYYFDFISKEYGRSSDVYIKKNIHDEGVKVIDPDDYKDQKSDKVKVKELRVSDDNNYIAFSTSRNGSDWQTIHVKTLYPFHKCVDVLEGIKFSNIEWSGNGFFYKRYPAVVDNFKAETLHSSIWYHKLGDEQSNDILVYQNVEDPEASLYFEKLVHGNYLIIYDNSNDSSNNRFKKILAINLNVPQTSFKIDTIIYTHQSASFDIVGVYNNEFLATTTLDAPHGKCVLFNLTEKNRGENFIPEYEEIQESVNIVGNKLLITYLDDADYLNITYDHNGKALKRMKFPSGSSVGGFETPGNDPNDSITIYYFSSFIYPPVAYQYNVNSLTTKLIDETKILYDYTRMEVRKVFYNSKDGTKIPMFIACKKDIDLDGTNPAILYGYGGNGINMTPFYDRGFVSFIENGGLVALPCIRGGGEYGEDWHKKGKGFNKQNVFDDFIGAAEYLFKEGYTGSEHLTLMGGSNGGLLVAAVANQRPDICKVVIADRGVYDMLRYQNYTIGNAWKKEYGSSNDPKEFLNLLKYSPLHNVKETSYPATLVVTADHDDRVVPLHSYKYVATMQQKNIGPNPIILYVEKNTGHQDFELQTDTYIYSFIYENIKVSPRDIHNLEY